MGKRESSEGDPGDPRDHGTNKNELHSKQHGGLHFARRCDIETERDFLLHILAIESGSDSTPFDRIISDGFDLPPPERLSDVSLTRKVNALIQVLAKYRVFLERTDHLSDRELYTWLWGEALRQDLMGFGLSIGNCHLDVLGGCSDEDLILNMRYYADDDERSNWATRFPDFPMPPAQKPPYDRDRHLPKPEY